MKVYALRLCAIVSVFIASAGGVAGQEGMSYQASSLAKERVLAHDATWAKTMADHVTQSGTTANLAAFQQILKQGYQAIFGGEPTGTHFFQTPAIIGGNPIGGGGGTKVPLVLTDPRYLNSLGRALGERIWIPSHQSTPTQYPETVVLVAFDPTGADPGSKAVCTGTVIGARAILTAAHCGCLLGDLVKVIVGTSNIASPDGYPVRVVNMNSRISKKDCPAYRASTPDARRKVLQAVGDAAVMFLDEDLSRFNIKPARLGMPFVSQKSYYIVGYGVTDSSAVAGQKNIGTIQGVTCSAVDQDRYGCNPSMEFWGGGSPIAGRDDRVDTCEGDSGGPVFVTDGVSPPGVVGITSRSVNNTYCGQGGIYVRLDGDLLSWVMNSLTPVATGTPVAVGEPGGLR